MTAEASALVLMLFCSSVFAAANSESETASVIPYPASVVALSALPSRAVLIVLTASLSYVFVAPSVMP